MDGKANLAHVAPTIASHGTGTIGTSTRRARSGILCLFATIIALLYTLPNLTLPNHCGGHGANVNKKHTYDGESIEWEWCGEVNDHPFECGSIQVPLDQYDTDNPVNSKHFTIPVKRLRAENATQNMFFNPGGPGGSGLEFITKRAERFNKLIGEGFHLVSFDPRGVGSSEPVFSCFPDNTTRVGRSVVSDRVKDSLSLYAWSANFGQACADTAGEHGRYVNTPQTAADMNSILDALGQEKMVYWGFSYGTTLGQTYADIFPERVGRVIIDGVSNQIIWFGTHVDTEEFEDTDNSVDEFVRLCHEAGKDCPLYDQDQTAQELRRNVTGFAQSLKDAPISVYVNSTTYGVIDYDRFWYGTMLMVMYKPMIWRDFAGNLSMAMQGNATGLFLEYMSAGYTGIDAQNEAYWGVEINDGLSGPKHLPSGLDEMLDLLKPLYNGSSFGPAEQMIDFIRQQWKIERTHKYVPRHKVKTAHPLLILSTTYDPICPLKSAKSARGIFEDSRLVEIKGHGHCSLSSPSLCVNKLVRDYFYHGTLPDEDMTCERDVSYFEPDQDWEGVGSMAADHPQSDREVLQAQIELSREMQWRGRW